jgi:hypothetical protein
MEDTILVVGVPRFGTTWQMKILVALPRYIYIFEALNPI